MTNRMRLYMTRMNHFDSALCVKPFSIMVALSRVVLGLHYPSDVLAGAMIGIVMSLTSMYIML
ncbi:MAG: phosphatase PAP2 family protein [Methylophilaceae bacterium]|nr:phosphatase PAP2 family protein [Methylophilaceae bacterium]